MNDLTASDFVMTVGVLALFCIAWMLSNISDALQGIREAQEALVDSARDDDDG